LVIPKTLAVNGGFDSQDLIVKLQVYFKGHCRARQLTFLRKSMQAETPWG